MKTLRFKVFSGGTLEFDLDKCEICQTKPCVEACNSPNMGSVLGLKDGHPDLKVKEADVAKGACTECLSCEFACNSMGKRAIRVILPIPGLDA